MPLVTSDMTLSLIISKYPDTKDVFLSNGLKDENMTESFLSAMTLQTFMSLRNLNPEIFMKIIDGAAEACSVQKILYTTEVPPMRADFLGYVVCPFKHLYKEELENVLHSHYEKTGDRLISFVPMGCGGPDPYEYIWETENIDDLPDVIASVGFGAFYREKFRKKYLNTGMFKSVQALPVPSPFEQLRDPKGIYTIYSISAYVMLIDHKKLNGLPVPKRWMDITDPMYHDNVIIGGNEDEVNEVLLMYLWQEGGDEALKRFAPNVKAAWHSSQMAKAAGSSMKTGAAIYVLPWFFASTCPNAPHSEVIFPEDGALASPMYMLVKTDKIERMKPVTDFVTGKMLGDISAKSLFPSLNPDAIKVLPEGAGIKWFGWDFIHSHDMKELAESLNKKFVSMHKNKNVMTETHGGITLAKPDKGFLKKVVKG